MQSRWLVFLRQNKLVLLEASPCSVLGMSEGLGIFVPCPWHVEGWGAGQAPPELAQPGSVWAPLFVSCVVNCCFPTSEMRLDMIFKSLQSSSGACWTRCLQSRDLSVAEGAQRCTPALQTLPLPLDGSCSGCRSLALMVSPGVSGVPLGPGPQSITRG